MKTYQELIASVDAKKLKKIVREDLTVIPMGSTLPVTDLGTRKSSTNNYNHEVMLPNNQTAEVWENDSMGNPMVELATDETGQHWVILLKDLYPSNGKLLPTRGGSFKRN